MKTRALIAAVFAIGIMPLIFSAPASAQATRTWVSGVGDDVNPCSRTAPCKTFAGAISKTAAGGEINCLDAGGFGAVTITKSLAIVCDGYGAGVLASITNGIIVNAAGAIVYLSGLEIHGGPPSQPGLSGIRFLAGASLHVRNTTIRAFNGNPGMGINFIPSTVAELTVDNVTIADNLNATSAGINIAPTGTGFASATIANSTISNNTNCILTTSTGTGRIELVVTNTVCTGNTNSGLGIFDTTVGAPTDVTVDNSVISDNGTALALNGAAVAVRIGGSIISGNGTGVAITNSAVLRSFGDNEVGGNIVPGPAMVTAPLQ